MFHSRNRGRLGRVCGLGPHRPKSAAAGGASHGGAVSCRRRDWAGARRADRRLAAIGARHRQHGFAAPAADPLVKAAMRAARQAALGRRRPPPPAERLVRMAAACPGDLAGLRDRAMLLLAAAGLDRKALVGLESEHVGVVPTGATLTLPERTAGHSPRWLPLARNDRFGACPVRALEEWLRVSDPRFGPVFRKIDRWGNLEHRAFGTDAVRYILRRWAVRRPLSRSPA